MARRTRPPCRNKAMDLLARRPHFRRELAAKLAARGYDEGEIGTELDRLEEEFLIDDRATARGFVEHRLAREPLGRRRLLADLARRGAPEDLARDAVDALYPDEGELAAAAAERWRARAADADDSAALGRHLERRGFSRGAIFRILKEDR